MTQLLIIENDPGDVHVAERVALNSGFASLTAATSPTEAFSILQRAQDEGRDIPDAILLDLDLGQESGFDFLRLRYATPWLLKIPLVVWTKLDDHNESICEIFNVQGYVRKSSKDHDLYKALEDIMLQPPQDK